MSAPRYIALCGAPESGKTELARCLTLDFGAVLVDDGACLRRGVSALFGIPLTDLHDMERKRDIVTVCGREFTKRQLLGDLGNQLERFYGDQIMPDLTLASLEDDPAIPFYVFASVRKNQGISYKERGGIVIELQRDGKVPINDFDHYDQTLVDHVITNDGSILDLRQKGRDLMSRWYNPILEVS